MRDEGHTSSVPAGAKRRLSIAPAALLCLAFLAAGAGAAGAQWRPIPAQASWMESQTAFDGAINFMLGARGAIFAGVEKTGLFASRDGGLSWIQVAEGSPACSASAGSDVYVCGDFPGLAKFLVSADNGATWESRRFAVREAGGEAVPGFAFLTSLAASDTAAGERLLLAGSLDGAYVSRDGGLSFEPAQGGLPKPLRVFSVAADGETLFVGAEQGLFVSRDGAGTWSRANPGSTGPVLRVRARDGRCLASVQADGDFEVRASDDAGRTWRTVGSGEAECVAFADLGPGGTSVAAFDDYRTAVLATGASALADIVTAFPLYAGGPGSRDDSPTALLGAGGYLYMGSSEGRVYRLPAAGAAPRTAP